MGVETLIADRIPLRSVSSSSSKGFRPSAQAEADRYINQGSSGRREIAYLWFGQYMNKKG